MLRELARSELPAVQEVHARLLRLYPEVDIAHMPSDLIQQAAQQPPPHDAEAQAEAADNGAAQHAVDCDQFVANAAVAGDTFAWHIDADPAGASFNHNPSAYRAMCWCSVRQGHGDHS